MKIDISQKIQLLKSEFVPGTQTIIGKSIKTNHKRIKAMTGVNNRAEEVVTAWINSEGHRANILNPDFTHIGVGYVKDGNIWTQQFIKQ